MNLLTASNSSTNVKGQPVIQLQDVSVRYRLPQERIPSFKEYAIRWLRGQIRFQEFWALQNLTLDVFGGEVFGIIGSNGAGKSTLLKVIARVLRPTRGVVRVNGRVAPLLELGAGFDFELTGRENVYLNSAILGHSRRDTGLRLARIIEFSGLAEFIDAPLRTYSTGMVARLGFAVATDVRPEILIVDEILSVGDAEFQTRSFERIQEFRSRGTTILLVSHSLGKVEEMCSRALWLDRGEVKILSDAHTTIARYLEMVRLEEEQRMAHSRQETPAALEPASVASEPARRWGSGAIEITQVRITNDQGEEQGVFQTGQPLLLQMDYIAHRPIQSPAFGIAIHRQDGAHMTGPNTNFAGLDLGLVEGTGKVLFRIPSLPLLEGLYHFSVASHNHEDTELFDYHDRLYSFRIFNQGSAMRERFGLMTVQGEWRHLPAAEAHQ